MLEPLIEGLECKSEEHRLSTLLIVRLNERFLGKNGGMALLCCIYEFDNFI